MDSVQIIKFSKGGRPIVQYDLNDGAATTFIRDAFTIDAPERQQQYSESTIRYDGQRLANETHNNGALSSEWYIGGATADLALAQMELFFGQVESLAAGRYIRVKLEGSTRYTYYEIRGPAPWDFMYRWVEFAGTKKLHVKAGWSVAPLAEGERMEIIDPFDVNSLTDYTAMTGSGLAYNAGGWLETAATTEQQYAHTARGYKYGDAQVTMKFTTGPTVGAADIAAILSQSDANNYLAVRAVSGVQLAVYKKDAGVFTQLATVAIGALAASTAHWVVIREEGNVVFAELWITNPPTPMGTPAGFISATLAGGDATKYGFGSTGLSGLRAILPSPSGWKINEFKVEPYTYRNKTLPASVQLGGAIPGDAPSLATATITPAGGAAAPLFGMVAWATRPSASTVSASAPFGILEGESATLTTWASTADANYRGGNGAKATTAGAGSASAMFGLDPATMLPDDLQRSELDVEVWARIELATTVVSPTLTVSVEPGGGTNFGAARTTPEYGATGKQITKPSAGTTFRFVRLGTLTLAVDPNNPVKWNLRLAASWAAGSSGQFGLDYIVLVPSRGRAAGPSNKPNDSTYPKFVASTGETIRTILPNGRGLNQQPGQGMYPDAGLGGSPLWFPQGNVDALVKLSSLAPDDPTVDATTEQLAHSATIRFSPVPRYYLPRGT